MYKVASDRRQSSLHRGRLSDWVDGGLPAPSPEEEWENCRRVIRDMEEKLRAPDLNAEERQAIGLRKLALQDRVKELKPLVGIIKEARRGIPSFFIEAAKERLSSAEYKVLYNDAVKREAKARAEAEKALAEGQAA